MRLESVGSLWQMSKLDDADSIAISYHQSIGFFCGVLVAKWLMHIHYNCTVHGSIPDQGTPVACLPLPHFLSDYTYCQIKANMLKK